MRSPRLVHLRFRRALGDAEDGADLAVVEALDVVQQEGGAGGVGQRGDGALEVDRRARAQPAARRRRRDVGGVVGVEFIGHLALAVTAAAQAIQADVHRQPVEPRGQRRFAAERLELAEHREEHVLDGVLGVLGRPDHAAREAQHARRVPPVELFAGVPFSGAAARHQAAVVVVGRGFGNRGAASVISNAPLDGTPPAWGCRAFASPAQIGETADPAAGRTSRLRRRAAAIFRRGSV
jgi:hypothetical protein